MTRIDFYVLDNPTPDLHDRMLCRVVEKAWQQGHQVYVQCEDADQARAFDTLLWRFQDTSFVPHALADNDTDTGDTPVLIGLRAETVRTPDVLVNLSQQVPATASQFSRVVESAGFDEISRNAARTRYRHYQERGFPLNTHKLAR